MAIFCFLQIEINPKFWPTFTIILSHILCPVSHIQHCFLLLSHPSQSPYFCKQTPSHLHSWVSCAEDQELDLICPIHVNLPRLSSTPVTHQLHAVYLNDYNSRVDILFPWTLQISITIFAQSPPPNIVETIHLKVWEKRWPCTTDIVAYVGSRAME